MRKLALLALAIPATLLSLPAQNPCSSNTLSTSLVTLEPFGASWYLGSPGTILPTYTGFGLFFDLDVSSDVVITALETQLYDEGVGNPPVPNQVGNTAPVNIYTCATTWSGNELVLPGAGSPWTLAGSGTITVTLSDVTLAPAFGHSPIVLNAPIPMTAGTYGVAIEIQQTTAGPITPYGPLHALYVDPAVAPNAPLSVSDQFLTISNQNITNDIFYAGTGGNTVNNLEIFYDSLPDSAYFTEYGTGCYNLSRSFYEIFDLTITPPNPFDMNGLTLSMTPIGPVNAPESYFVAPAAPVWFTPTSPPLQGTAAPPAFGDDDVTAPITLPFTLDYPGGSTTQIVVGSNGSLFLDPTLAPVGGYYWYSVPEILEGGALLAPFWTDLDPSVGGSVHYDVDSAGVVYVTWLNVQEWNQPAAVNTFQVAIFPGGAIEYRYQTCSLTPPNTTGTSGAVTASPAFVAWTPGNFDPDPGQQDLAVNNVVMPFLTGDGGRALALTADARPAIGTTFNMVTNDIRPSSTMGFLIAGFQADVPGTTLASIGMPGCSSYFMYGSGQVLTTLLFPITGQNPVPVPLTVPNNSLLLGTQVVVQVGVETTSLPAYTNNIPGIQSSNGVCLFIGN